jgi:hypothetical protein
MAHLLWAAVVQIARMGQMVGGEAGLRAFSAEILVEGSRLEHMVSGSEQGGGYLCILKAIRTERSSGRDNRI